MSVPRLIPCIVCQLQRGVRITVNSQRLITATLSIDEPTDLTVTHPSKIEPGEWQEIVLCVTELNVGLIIDGVQGPLVPHQLSRFIGTTIGVFCTALAITAWRMHTLYLQ